VNLSIVFQQETMVARRGLAPATSGTRQDGSCNSTHAFLTNSTVKFGAAQLQVLIADERVCGRNSALRPPRRASLVFGMAQVVVMSPVVRDGTNHGS
jgi:hypothetical protein